MRKFVVALAIGLIMPGCQSRVIDNSTIVEPGLPPSYAQDVQPILTSSCAGSGCHIGSSTSGVRLNSYGSVMASRGVRYGRLIVEPGQPVQSPLVDKISADPDFGARMPLRRSPLSNSEIAIITTWIEEGAKDN